MKIELNTSWLAGKYSWKIDKGMNTVEAEINTSIPYVAIGDYFWQDEQADSVINEIHAIWIKGRCSVKTAIKKYENLYLL